MKRITLLLLAAFCSLTLSACHTAAPAASSGAASSIPSSAPSESSPAQLPEPPAPTEEELAAQEIEALLSSMTLEEKVGQLFFVRVPTSEAVADVSAYHLGGYLLFGRDFQNAAGSWLTAEQIQENLSSYQAAAKIPLLIGVDEEGGTVVRASANPNLRASKFKSPQKLFASGGIDAIIADAQEKDALLSSLGINVNLAPVCDLSTNSKDFIYDRAFGQGAEETAAYVSAVTQAMSNDGMGSVLKHFPGYGDNVDTHTGVAIDNRPLETFETADFLPFQAGISGGGDLTAVLVSHNMIQCMDSTLPASLSPAVHQILREDLGFNGVVMTDDLVMDAVKRYAADGSVAVLAIQAGNDLLIATDYRTQIPQVIAAVQDGTLDETLIDAACTRVLAWKQALGLLENIPSAS